MVLSYFLSNCTLLQKKLMANSITNVFICWARFYERSLFRIRYLGTGNFNLFYYHSLRICQLMGFSSKRSDRFLFPEQNLYRTSSRYIVIRRRLVRFGGKQCRCWHAAKGRGEVTGRRWTAFRGHQPTHFHPACPTYCTPSSPHHPLHHFRFRRCCEGQ